MLDQTQRSGLAKTPPIGWRSWKELSDGSHAVLLLNRGVATLEAAAPEAAL